MRIDLDSGYSIRSFLYGDAISLTKHGDNWNIAKNLRDSFPHPYTLEHARAWIQHIKNHEADTRFVIDFKGEAIGEIGFVVQPDVHRFSAEIGYWLAEEHWGKGVMSTALQRVVSYAIEKKGVKRIYADVAEHNEASAVVLKRCGFELEGVLKKHICKDGAFYDQHIYGLVKTNTEQ